MVHIKFHDRVLNGHAELNEAWKVAHGVNADTTVSVSNGCEDLMFYAREPSCRPHRRLGLAPSSTLAGGMVAIYSKQIHHLLQDTQNLIYGKVDKNWKDAGSSTDSDSDEDNISLADEPKPISSISLFDQLLDNNSTNRDSRSYDQSHASLVEYSDTSDDQLLDRVYSDNTTPPQPVLKVTGMVGCYEDEADDTVQTEAELLDHNWHDLSVIPEVSRETKSKNSQSIEENISSAKSPKLSNAIHISYVDLPKSPIIPCTIEQRKTHKRKCVDSEIETGQTSNVNQPMVRDLNAHDNPQKVSIRHHITKRRNSAPEYKTSYFYFETSSITKTNDNTETTESADMHPSNVGSKHRNVAKKSKFMSLSRKTSLPMELRAVLEEGIAAETNSECHDTQDDEEDINAVQIDDETEDTDGSDDSGPECQIHLYRSKGDRIPIYMVYSKVKPEIKKLFK